MSSSVLGVGAFVIVPLDSVVYGRGGQWPLQCGSH